MKILILFICTSLCIVTQAQDSLKSIRFILEPSIGISIPLTSIQDGSITDNLISNKATPSFHLQVSATYFWKHWGLGGSITLNNSNNPQNFVDDLRQYYSDQYYVNTVNYGNSSSLFNPVIKLLFGPSYKVEKEKFIFIYKLQLGINRFHALSTSANLKEKNSNTIVTLDWTYSHQDYDPDFFCVSPAISIGYRITNRISIGFDVMFMYSKGSITFYQLSENVNTHQTQTENFHYNNAINELNLGGSLLYLFNRKSKAKKS